MLLENSYKSVIGPGTMYFNVPELSEARRIGSKLFDPHDLTILENKHQFRFSCQHNRLSDSMSVSRMQFGASVNIKTNRTDDFILVHVPLAGRNEVSNNGHRVIGSPSLYTVSNTSKQLTQLRTADCDMVTLRVSMNSVQHYIEYTLGQPIKQMPVFQMEMASTGRAGIALAHLVQLLLGSVQGCSGYDADLLSAPIEQMLLAILMTSQPNNYDQSLRSRSASVAPHYIRKAEEYIVEHADKELTISGIAEHVGICSRTLFIGFRKYRQTTPMEFAKSIRLTGVREQLLTDSGDKVSITNIASNWGFLHHGNFTNAYKRKFGELPSQTLRFKKVR